MILIIFQPLFTEMTYINSDIFPVPILLVILF